ncbi:hypothetical protein BC940DRAFT_44551 [Gongronella butleri]|nr:hypothetical protein BC940DRAFT_44551 [Gongronella butleri]
MAAVPVDRLKRVISCFSLLILVFGFFSIVEFGREMKKSDMDRLLHDLGIDFEPMEAMLLIHPIYKSAFTYNIFDDMQMLYECDVDVYRGLQKYHFHSFYEVMLWYRFYICKKGYRAHLLPSKRDSHAEGINQYKSTNHGYVISNYIYMSRIPEHIRNLDRTKGLGVVREAMFKCIEKHQGIPPYFANDILDKKICYIVK